MILGKCMTCGQVLIKEHILLGYCDECGTPVGEKGWKEWEKAEVK